MNYLRNLCIGLLLLLSVSACSGGAFNSEAYPRDVINTNVTLLDGQYVNLNKQKGRTKVIAFWSTGCSKSRYQIQELNKLAKKLRYRPDIRFYAVNLDAEARESGVRDFIDRKELNYMVHTFSGNGGEDESFLRYKNDTSNLPQFYVISDRYLLAGGKKASYIENELLRLAP